MARQQAIYLSKILKEEEKEDKVPFKFFNLGSMASVGEMKGLYDGSGIGQKGKEINVPGMTGFFALLMWRYAYWDMQTSFENKMLISVHWLKVSNLSSKKILQIFSFITFCTIAHYHCYIYVFGIAKSFFFGRDISRF